MPVYRYAGKLIDGSDVQGSMSAVDEAELESQLLNKGIYLGDFRPIHGRLRMLITRVLKGAEITKVTRQIGVLLKSEISILETFELVREQVNDRVLTDILDNLIREIESGRSVAAALAEYPTIFDRLYVSMVDAGELSGELDMAFDRIATYREKREATGRKIKSAIAYPLLVILVAIVVVLALVIYIVPIFSAMYENFGAELPSLTRGIVQVSDVVRESLWYWPILLLLSVAALIYSSSTARVRYAIHRFLTVMPLARNLTAKIISARFCRTMGALLTSGVDIIRALQISSRTTGNSYVDSALQSAEMQLAQGKSFTESVSSTSVFPKTMLRMAASGEKTGRLGEMLERAADYYERETEQEIGTLVALIEPVIIILLGIFVAFVLIAMYLPLFDLVGTIRG